MITVMLVDDHHRMRQMLREIVAAEADLSVVAEAADGRTAVDRARELRPDVILMDIDLPELSGIQATREIVAWLPQARIVMLTVSSAEEDLFESLRAGARGYITKDARRSEIVAAIRSGYEGVLPLTGPMATRVLGYFRSHGPVPADQSMAVLTPREREILSLLARGQRDKEIGYQLGISPATVKKHVENILRKLHVRTRAEAAARFTGQRNPPYTSN